jgi:Glucose / Sorbosone dehydrogenase
MLRIDVNNGLPYTIPASNPYFGQTDTLPEIWALGMRNPWKFSFDALTGDMWIGDVGQNNWEEIDMEPAGSAGGYNWGWRCYEGFNPNNTGGCNGIAFYDFPVDEYNHGAPYNFCSITGGLVYRGSKYPGMQGHYFFTDYCAGAIYSLFPNGLGGYTETLVDAGPGFGNVAFGTDKNQNLYLCNISGTIYKVVDNCGTFNPSISANGTGGLISTAGTQYWWWQNGTIVSGATSQNYAPTSSGTFYATVSNGTCTRRTNSIQWVVQGGIPGCTYPSASNYNPDADVDDGSCIFDILGCTNPLAINYDPSATLEDGSCIIGTVGCMEPFACNYDPFAEYSDCSLCDFTSCLGCTEPCASNFDPSAIIDDGSCEPCTPGTCQADFNGDGLVGISDLLFFVGQFGVECP